MYRQNIGGGLKRLSLIGAALAVTCALPAMARDLVTLNMPAEPGTIIVRTAERRLYLVQGDGTAIRYRVAVGRAGKQWTGEARIDGKYVNPAWAPPAEVKRDNPRLPDVIPGGSPANPMGVRALTLDRDEYAIHGTNRPGSIGTYASYGCIRMLNDDIVDLYARVGVGTRVVVTR
jgi:lipoprotein-anchoring transpeptidase ErfK/SrfK